MTRVVTISEAASIAIHSMVLIANSKKKINVTQLADAMGSSRHHVAKVVQRLVKEDILSSVRGPHGGFSLKKKPEDISLLKIFESIEGQIEITECPMDNPICPFDKCIMGNLVKKMTTEFRNYFQEHTLKDYIKEM